MGHDSEHLEASSYRERYMVHPGEAADILQRDPDDTDDLADKKQAKKIIKKNLKTMARLQYRLYAESQRALLIVLQAMDAGGKDGTIRHVMGPLNPQGCRVTSFKQPSGEERAHDFLWRIHRATPRKGEIAIFNRSHYEDVLVVRVHELVPEEQWRQRYEQINQFEKTLAENHVHILKLYLHISPDEQLERFKDRIKDPDKHWKLSEHDFEERNYWDDYMAAFEEALTRCSTPWAPWFVIPANKKWFRNLAVSHIINETLGQLDMQFPDPTCDIEQLLEQYPKAR